jgi:hypothetical protein
MRYQLFGQTGLRVSELFLGAMTFGEQGGVGAPVEECGRMVNAYADAGGNVIDTASNYRGGLSETIVGELLEGRRDRFVLATTYTVSRDQTDPNGAGNHRKNLVLSLETSLKRLRTDYVDVYWVHIWDARTPVDDEPATPEGMQWRRSLELEVLAAGGVVVRPAFVFGHGGNEILRALIRAAAASGVAAYPGDGRNSWPNVHVDDLAALYLAAVASGARGAVFHGVGGEATVRSVCESIARLVGGVGVSLPPNEARAVVPFADWIGGASIQAGKVRTREALSWMPMGPNVHDDVEHGSYRSVLQEEG